VARVRRPEALRHEALDGLPEQLGAPVAEEALQGRIDEDDAPGRVGQHDRVRHRFEQPVEGRRLRLPDVREQMADAAGVEVPGCSRGIVGRRGGAKSVRAPAI
jgi:hypothetical protein